MSNPHVWLAAQERLRQEMTRTQFDTWLRGTWLADERDDVTVLCVRTTFAKEYLETRFLTSFVRKNHGHESKRQSRVSLDATVDCCSKWRPEIRSRPETLVL